ncbi:MAG: TonB-dependent receptor [Bacteroidales bacterium]|nr:TonB-dependent receptor [Bacteroidales bacterium]MBN2818158.1 TonB-dependent receptor [Bacteroidales bacterium]
MKSIVSLFLFLFSVSLMGQTISGHIFDKHNKPLPSANIYIKGTYNGATSDTSGYFLLQTSMHDSCMLVVSFLGYESYNLLLTKSLVKKALKITLTESTNSLDEVIISAGTFEAGEKKRAVTLNPIEIATTGGSDGDIYNVLATFPGVQKQGETGKIIVRGGEADESKTYIDGMLVSSPYTSTTPDLPARGRFEPFMFSGVMFSTGGYSAEYGQALSSVLELKTPALFEEDMLSISLINVGPGISYTRHNDTRAFSGGVNYNNLFPYFLMSKSNLNWIKIPESYSGKLHYRQKTKNSGLIKSDFNISHGNSILDYSEMSDEYQRIGLENTNMYAKTNYNSELTDKWIMKTGVAFNRNIDKKEFNNDKLNENLQSAHFRLGFTNYYNKNITLKIGLEDYLLDYSFNYVTSDLNTNIPLNTTDNINSCYVENDLRITKKLAVRLGLRGEYSSLTENVSLSPRTSIAYKINKASQLSFAGGSFSQQSHHAYLKYNPSLNFEKAQHYILNYQAEKDNRMFRTEVYYKKYNSLVTFTPGIQKEYENIQNTGTGYARGFDLFIKDSKTISYLDFYASYSFVDSKRKFKDYPTAVCPEFVSKHNFNLASKYWIDKIHSQLSLTYSYAKGRPYNNPNSDQFMSSKTMDWHDLSGNISYITNISGNLTVVHLSVSNILGKENIYAYRFSRQPDNSGFYSSTPIKSGLERSVIIGVFISID